MPAAVNTWKRTAGSGFYFRVGDSNGYKSVLVADHDALRLYEKLHELLKEIHAPFTKSINDCQHRPYGYCPYCGEELCQKEHDD